ncbi:MAG TPA: excinuclease ATPase subunit [Candidatus Binatia bacterium]
MDGSVKFFFGKGAKTPEALQRVGGDMVRARQKNSSGVREDVCNAAFWRSLATLSTRAKRLGANALVNIVSSFGDHPEFSSATEFECYQGSRITSVAFKADFVKIGDK